MNVQITGVSNIGQVETHALANGTLVLVKLQRERARECARESACRTIETPVIGLWSFNGVNLDVD